METSTPVPDDTVAAVLGIEFIAIALLYAALGFLLVYIIVRVGRQHPTAMIPLLVFVVTLIALITFAITREEGLETIAATGLGALAGALTYLYQQPIFDSTVDDNGEDDYPYEDEDGPEAL